MATFVFSASPIQTSMQCLPHFFFWSILFKKIHLTSHLSPINSNNNNRDWIAWNNACPLFPCPKGFKNSSLQHEPNLLSGLYKQMAFILHPTFILLVPPRLTPLFSAAWAGLIHSTLVLLLMECFSTGILSLDLIALITLLILHLPPSLSKTLPVYRTFSLL